MDEASTPEATVLNERDGARFVQHGADTLLRAALRAGVGLAHECNSGGCGACVFERVEGDVEVLWPEAPGLKARDRARGRQLACQCRARGPVRIRAASGAAYVPPVRPVRRSVRLVAAIALTHDIREFRFMADEPAQFLPGQFAMLDLPGLASSRAYSMANTPNSQGMWSFCVRRTPTGAGTRILFEELRPGTWLSLDGPYGLAYLRRDSPRDIVCVAGGSGLAPMLSIVRGAAEAGMLHERTLHFFYGARTPRDVCGGDVLDGLRQAGHRVHFHPAVSQPDPGGQWEGATGFIHDHVARVLGSALCEHEFYCAGPPPMTQALQEMLMLTHHVPFEQIHFDRFF